MRVVDSRRRRTRRRLTKSQWLVRVAISSVAPSIAPATGFHSFDVVDGANDDDVIKYMDAHNCRPPPLFIPVVSIIELIIFIVYAIQLKQQGIEVDFFSGLPRDSPLVYNPCVRYQAWRYLTYMLIHDGISHILFNLVFQLAVGLPLELVHKFWRVGIVYCFGVIAGSLGVSLFDPKKYLCGASGGCYALIGAHFATIILNWKNMTHDWMKGPVKFMFSAPVKLTLWSLFLIVDIVQAIWRSHADGKNVTEVSYVGHFAGALAGVLIGIPVLKNLEKLRWERVLQCVCGALSVSFILFAVLWNVFNRNHFLESRNCSLRVKTQSNVTWPHISQTEPSSTCTPETESWSTRNPHTEPLNIGTSQTESESNSIMSTSSFEATFNTSIISKAESAETTTNLVEYISTVLTEQTTYLSTTIQDIASYQNEIIDSNSTISAGVTSYSVNKISSKEIPHLNTTITTRETPSSNGSVTLDVTSETVSLSTADLSNSNTS